jgi:hypothetical protein
LEEEEEIWFNSEDDDAEDNGADAVTPSHTAPIATNAQQVQTVALTTSPTSPIAFSKANVISPKANHSGGSNSPIIGASSNGGSSSPSTLSPSTSPVPPLTDVQSPSTMKKVISLVRIVCVNLCLISFRKMYFKALVDYDGDSEEEEEADTDPIPGEKIVEEVEPKKDIDSAVPVISPVDGEDDDVESPNKRAKLT